MKLLTISHGSKAFLGEIIKKLEDGMNNFEEGIVLIYENQSHVEATDNYSIIKRIEENPNKYCKNIIENIKDDYYDVDVEELTNRTNSISYPFNKNIHNQNVKVKSKFNYQKVKRFYNTKIK